jgi:hypothetical protein
MCKFASFELTINEAFWVKSDKHNEIIEQFCPHKDGVRGPNSVSVELTPPVNGDWADLSTWTYEVDQDIKPEWYLDDEVERRARETLAKRAAAEWPWLPLVASERAANFARATCTDPADRKRAEKAARAMANLGGLEGKMTATWVPNPTKGKELYDSLNDSLRNSLNDSLRNSLYDSLNDSLRNSLNDSLCDSLNDLLRNSLNDSLRNSLNDSLYDSLYASLNDSLRNSLNDSLCDSLNDLLRNSLNDLLRNSLYDSLRNSLYDSLRNSLYDSNWISLYESALKLGAKYPDRDAELLNLHGELLSSSYALWLLPNNIILCDRPSSIETAGGKVVDVKWERAS